MGKVQWTGVPQTVDKVVRVQCIKGLPRGQGQRAENDNDNDTHSGKVNQHQSEAWPYGHERRGHNPAKKNLVMLLCLALLARCATGTLLTTVHTAT